MKYMSMIGQLQWAITLGRYDILAHVMSMSRFRLGPPIDPDKNMNGLELFMEMSNKKSQQIYLNHLGKE